MDKFLKGLGWAVIVTFALVFMTPLVVMFGWFTGVILKFFCGNIISAGLNLLFNTSRFTPEVIPYITATLSALCGYFITRTTVQNS